MKTTHHIRCDIRGLLRNAINDPSILDHTFTSNGVSLSKEQAIDNLADMLAAGKTGIPSAGCTNYDPITGACAGHPVAAKEQA